jgi:hypothetical protein
MEGHQLKLLLLISRLLLNRLAYFIITNKKLACIQYCHN